MDDFEYNWDINKNIFETKYRIYIERFIPKYQNTFQKWKSVFRIYFLAYTEYLTAIYAFEKLSKILRKWKISLVRKKRI